jgi:molecular chaperone DnaJ
MTLHGKGMPSLRTRRRGDQRIVVNVVIPRKLDDRQRGLLEQLSDSLTPENLTQEHEDQSVFQRVRRAFK